MSVNYNKLWKLLIDRNLKKTEFARNCGISAPTLAKLSKNEVVSMKVMIRICEFLKCNIGDIVETK